MATTFAVARRKLPTFARGLVGGMNQSLSDSVRLAILRNAVKEEISAWRRGDNPLDVKQIEALQTWLRVTA